MHLPGRLLLAAALVFSAGAVTAQAPKLSHFHQWFNSVVEGNLAQVVEREIHRRLTARERREIGAVQLRVVKIGEERGDDCERASGPAYTTRLADGTHRVTVCGTAARYMMDLVEAFFIGSFAAEGGRLSEAQFVKALSYYAARGALASDALMLGRAPGPSCIPVSVVYMHATGQASGNCDPDLANATAVRMQQWWFRESGAAPLMNAIAKASGSGVVTEQTIRKELEEFAGATTIGALAFVIAHEYAHILNRDLTTSHVLKRGRSPAAVERSADQWALALVARDGGETPGGLLALAAIPVLMYVGIQGELLGEMNLDSPAATARLEASGKRAMETLRVLFATPEGRKVVQVVPGLAEKMRQLDSAGKLR